jgi:hypothetical protein
MYRLQGELLHDLNHKEVMMQVAQQNRKVIITVFMAFGLLGATMAAQPTAAYTAGGGPHVKVFDGSSATLNETEQADGLVDEGSTDRAAQTK